jgi:hypothetical protein
MAKIAYHVFKKPKKYKAKNGKERNFIAGIITIPILTEKNSKNHTPSCKNRSVAEMYIRTLPPPPGTKDAPDLLIRDIAENMYIPGSDHVSRRCQLGKSTELSP